MKRVMLLAALALLVSVGAARAESSLVGLMQAWWSYTAYEDTLSANNDATQTGFGLRRARAAWAYKQGDMGALVMSELSGNTLTILEAYGDWKFNDMLSLRAGRFAGVGSETAALTSAARLDLIDINLVGNRWAAGTVGADGRTIGAQLSVSPNEVFTLRALAHNGSGDLNANFAPNNNAHGDPTAGEFVITDEDTTFVPAPTMADTGALPQLDFGVYASPTPELRVGFTYGLPSEFRQTTGSMTAFVYYTKPAYFLKFDYATLMHNDAWDDNDLDYGSLGYSLTAGYGLNKKTELVGRYEFWDVNTDVDYDNPPRPAPPAVDPDKSMRPLVKNLAVGVNYYVNPDAKYDQVLKAAFTLRMDDMPDGVDIADPYLFQLQWQIFLH